MSTLFQALLSQAPTGQPLKARDVSRFTSTEIRQAIADLVGAQHIELADALSAAGLSLYPKSEEILAISALLAEIKQDWSTAEQLLTQLLALQGVQAPSSSWRHLIRVLRCQCEPGQALQVAQKAMAAYPTDALLREEHRSLQELVCGQVPLSASAQMH